MPGTTLPPRRTEWVQASVALALWPLWLGLSAAIGKHDISRFLVQFVKGWAIAASLNGITGFLFLVVVLALTLKFSARFGRLQPYRLYLVASLGMLLIPQGERFGGFDPRGFLWSFEMTYLVVDRLRAFIVLMRSAPNRQNIARLDEPLGRPWTLALTAIRLLLSMVLWDAALIVLWFLYSPGLSENYGAKYILSLQWIEDFRYGLMLQSGWGVVTQISSAFVIFELLRRHFGKPSWFALALMLLLIGQLNPALHGPVNGMGIAPPAATYAFGSTFVLFYMLGGAIRPLISGMVLRLQRASKLNKS